MQEEPYIISKKRTVRRYYPGRIVAAAVVTAVFVIGGILLFSYTRGYYGVAGREYGFVCMGDYASLSEAAARAGEVQSSGGAGYVYGEDIYRVMASCYGSRADAESVCARLADDGENATVFTLSRPKVRIDKSDENSEHAVRGAVLADKLFDELYDVSVKTDTREISEAAAKYAAVKLSGKADAYASEYSAYASEYCEYLAALFGRISESLSELGASGDNLPCRIKYALCEIASFICDR